MAVSRIEVGDVIRHATWYGASDPPRYVVVGVRPLVISMPEGTHQWATIHVVSHYERLGRADKCVLDVCLAERRRRMDRTG